MVTININFRNKTFYLLVGILGILIVAGIGVAYNSGGPASVIGHSFDEIKLPACAEGEGLVKTASGWGCGVLGSGSIARKCVSVTSAVGANGEWYSLNLIVDGENVCAMPNGCDHLLSRISDSDGKINDIDDGGQAVQDSSGKMRERWSTESSILNGDDKYESIRTWNSCTVADDWSAMFGNSKDTLVLKDNSANYQCSLSVCARG